MKICIIGTGYVGLVTGTCFSEMGNDVICVDINKEKIDNLKQGIIPIYEPGLEELVKRNFKEERLSFTTDLKDAIDRSLLIFIAVDTPSREDGTPNLDKIKKVAEDIGKCINNYKIIINKSTVPVGTADIVRDIIKKQIEIRSEKEDFELIEFDMVSNPEFLKEGAAIDDFMKPDRIVVGTDNVRTGEIMKELYSPFVRNEHPIIVMDIKSAEMTKQAANAFLAMKISFINEIANICDIFGADVSNVKKGISSDSRIGSQFLFPGVGYGGSCFPKDVSILETISRENDYHTAIIGAANTVNNNQRKLFVKKITRYFNNDLKGLKLALWGLSYKPYTDDMRSAPSVDIINDLLEYGAEIYAYDPEAINNAKAIFEGKNIQFADNMYDALESADALILVTEWTQFRRPDFDKIKSLMKSHVIFDGRNQYEPANMKKLGFKYFCIGRPSV